MHLLGIDTRWTAFQYIKKNAFKLEVVGSQVETSLSETEPTLLKKVLSIDLVEAGKEEPEIRSSTKVCTVSIGLNELELQLEDASGSYAKDNTWRTERMD